MSFKMLSAAAIFCSIVSVYTQDVQVDTFTVKNPSLVYYVEIPVTVTFDLAMTEVASTAGSVTAVTLHFNNDGTTAPTSTAFSATFTTNPFPVPQGTSATITDATAEVTLPSTGCNTVTHVCAVITATGDSVDTNDFTCIAVGSGATQAGTKTCATGDCTALTLASGTVMPDTLTHGTEVTITCNGGTTLTGGDATRTCMNGEWSGTMPTCETSGGTTGGDCSALTAPTNGSLSSTVVTSGTDVTVSCNEGFTRCGDEKITCTDAKWSGAVATCKTECDDDDKDGGVIPTLSKFLAWNMIVVVLAFLNM